MESFAWKDASHSIWIPISVGILYLSVCIFHRLWFGETPRPLPMWKQIKSALPYHNIFLALLSAIMFFGCLHAVVLKSIRDGSVHWLFCESIGDATTGILEFWSYIFYLSKYYELLDTLFQIIRGKYPPHYFLHAYHHSVVLVMCWLWLEYRVSLRFVALLFNVFVHIVMYYYFYLKCVNVDPWWKKYVTSLQITQFAFSFVACIVTVYLHFASGDSCAGMGLLAAQVVFNATLLTGFVGVLKTTKSKKTT